MFLDFVKMVQNSEFSHTDDLKKAIIINTVFIKINIVALVAFD